MISPKNLVNHELIGLEIEIKNSENKSLIGKKGKVIDETKSTFIIQDKNKTKTIIKKGTLFVFNVDSQKIQIKGDYLQGNPWDRIKAKIKVKTRWQKNK